MSFILSNGCYLEAVDEMQPVVKTTFKDFIDTVSKLSDCTLYTCVCVCGSAPDSQHGVDLPDEVAELVHDLFQVLVLLLQLL